MADELVRVEVSPGRFKKLTAAQAAEYKAGTKESEPLDKTVSATGVTAAAHPEPAAKPKRRTTKRSTK